ncbi:MAG: cyclic beta 1-2 glucan synthetase, partial [Planctomycetes bacterium]|nr:cyclic beta 1-2 glucan synthetase [Planctomycetota bacterium]
MLLSVAVLTVAGALAVIAAVPVGALAPIAALALGAILAVAASGPALSLVNWCCTRLVAPKTLPRYDYSAGIPSDHRSLVVVPALLTSLEEADELVARLEVHFLANRDPHLQFALLSDFVDADAERRDEDEALLARARSGIEELNRLHAHEGEDGGEPFLLLHRPRRWNERERRWMGHERKRGKLEDLNRALRDPAALVVGGEQPFMLVVGDVSSLRRVKYVITLDADTQLPRDAAAQLVGTMAHPLNRPRFDEVRRVVVEGYGILQPRVAVSLPSAGRSWFSRLAAGEAGIDPYSRAVSDQYQDLFGAGSFIGKGIYDVDAVTKAFGDRFPEDRILSHDLLESCYARSGLVSDIELFEDWPSRYLADISRRHRWIRGDWQIARWLMPSVPLIAGRERNPLSTLSRWKLLDNLRRSLEPLAWTLALPALALAAPQSWAFVAVVALFSVPFVLPVLREAQNKTRELSWFTHVGNVVQSLVRQTLQAALAVAMLPYEAVVNADAVLRTLFRLTCSRRGLLEWTTASDAERKAHTALGGVVVSMAAAPLVAIAMAGLCVAWRPEALWAIAPLAALWCCAPIGAWLISKPLRVGPPALPHAQRRFLRRQARLIWRFFETFVTAEEHWLPPDNYQEHPARAIAHRTSPTNIGLSLLVNLGAADFSFIPLGVLLARTAGTFATLDQLERHRGHYLNWYDTHSLRPLPPMYVSTVDSGNLVGHLLVLRRGLLELCDRPIAGPELAEALADSAALLDEARARAGRRASPE